MGEAKIRDLNGLEIGSVMLDAMDPDDRRTIKYSIRKHLDKLVGEYVAQKMPHGRKANGGTLAHIELTRMKDDKYPHEPVCGIVLAVDTLGVIHYLAGKLPEQCYRRDIHNLIDHWAEECKGLVDAHLKGETIYTKAEYESVMGKHLGESPVELF